MEFPEEPESYAQSSIFKMICEICHPKEPKSNPTSTEQRFWAYAPKTSMSSGSICCAPPPSPGDTWQRAPSSPHSFFQIQVSHGWCILSDHELGRGLSYMPGRLENRGQASTLVTEGRKHRGENLLKMLNIHKRYNCPKKGSNSTPSGLWMWEDMAQGKDRESRMPMCVSHISTVWI